MGASVTAPLSCRCHLALLRRFATAAHHRHRRAPRRSAAAAATTPLLSLCLVVVVPVVARARRRCALERVLEGYHAALVVRISIAIRISTLGVAIVVVVSDPQSP